MAEKSSAKDLRGLPEAELKSRIEGIQHEMWLHRIKAKSGALNQVHQIGDLRRQIARIKTVMHEQRSNADGAKK